MVGTAVKGVGRRARRAGRLVGLVVLVGGQLLIARPASSAPVCNTTPIQVDIPTTPMSEVRRALPYPSTIAIAGLAGTITDVDVQLLDVTHPFPEDFDVLLVAPDGSTHLLVMSDVGGDNLNEVPHPVSDVNLTLSDEASSPMPINAQLSSGTFRPTDDDTDQFELLADHADTFFAPAPVTPGAATALSVFDGLAPNGTWSLYVVDDDPGPPTPAPQGLLGGWCLDITTSGASTSSSSTSTSSPSTTTGGPPTCDGAVATIVGTRNDDTIVGTPGDDVIVGLGGNDMIHGLGGNDRICGSGGNDQIDGGEGNDRLFGGDGNDRLVGGPGNNALFGEAGADQCLVTPTSTASTCEQVLAQS